MDNKWKFEWDKEWKEMKPIIKALVFDQEGRLMFVKGGIE